MKDEAESNFAARVRRNQQELSSALRTRFDYIVCGAGTAGCVVAARLAADPNTHVLLLEAGGTDEMDLVTDPNRWPLTLGSELDWGFVAEPNPHLNGRRIPYSMGKVLGGGSSINVSTWSRGHRADWDFYAAESGDASWRYEAILELYRARIEDWAGSPDPHYRGIGGAVHVQSAAEPHPFAFALLEGAESVGLERFPNPNGRMMEAPGGCALVDETVRDGRRRSIFRSYLYPLMDQPNVTVLTGALATRIVFERRRATGIEFLYQGETRRVEADREVILSLGAINTPKLLMQSGIGDADELKRADLPVVQALPGVGRNLHDHVAFGCVWESTETSPAQDAEKPDRMLLEDIAGVGRTRLLRLFASRTRCFPRKRGPVQAAGSLLVSGRRHATEQPGQHPPDRPEPSDPVRIDANYLADPQDLKDLVAGLRVARAIGNSAALRPFTGREVLPAVSDRSGPGALPSRWAGYLLASVLHREDGPRRDVGGRWQVEGPRRGAPSGCGRLHPAARDDRQHDGALRRHRRASGSVRAGRDDALR